jgi:hypothetical protein
VETNPSADDTAQRRVENGVMTTTDYIINIALIALVLLQIRATPMNLRNLIRPVAIVAAAAFYYLKGIPTAGNDLYLDVILVTLGIVLGATCALATRVWRHQDGTAYAKAGALAAALWIVGIGSRLAFELYATHGGAGSIARFSATRHITSSNAWTAALVMMALAEVLTRLLVLRVRGAKSKMVGASMNATPIAVSQPVA